SDIPSPCMFNYLHQVRFTLCYLSLCLPKFKPPAMASPWPSTPFRLISSTGVNTRRDIPPENFCRRNAQLMALTHNTIFRGLNAIYHHAPLVQPSTQEASDLLFYCTVVHDFIHEHHTTEET